MEKLLSAISAGHVYGYRIMEATKLPSGTVYPALARLEREGQIRCRWDLPTGDGSCRPRKCYELTKAGAETVREVLEQDKPKVEVG